MRRYLWLLLFCSSIALFLFSFWIAYEVDFKHADCYAEYYAGQPKGDDSPARCFVAEEGVVYDDTRDVAVLLLIPLFLLIPLTGWGYRRALRTK